MSKIFFIAYNNTGAAGDCQKRGKEIEGWKRNVYVQYWTQESRRVNRIVLRLTHLISSLRSHCAIITKISYGSGFFGVDLNYLG